MSTQGNFVAGSIEDILVALAQGIRDAQDRLNALEPFDAYGRPRPQYYLPHLDFTLKINAVETTTTDTAGGAAVGARQMEQLSRRSFAADGQRSFVEWRAPPLTFAVANPARTSSSATHEIYSTISGRFIAVPPNDGMPQIGLTVVSAAVAGEARKRSVTVTAGFAAGGAVSGATVEFNVDAGATGALNDLTTPPVIDSTQVFETGAVATDDDGVAATVVDFAKAPTGIQKLLVVVNIGPVRASLLVAEAG